LTGSSNPGTPHHVTVYVSLLALTKTAPPADGSRSANAAAMRGGPVRNRETSRSVLAVSDSPKVMFPSELMYAAACCLP